MSRNVRLVDVRSAETARDAAAPSVAGTPATLRRRAVPALLDRLRGWPGLTRTLSLLVPGAGQAVRGETAFGLFLFTASVFLWCFAWAILATLDRLAGTLVLLDISVSAAFWTLLGVYLLAGSLHLTSVLCTIEIPGAAGGVIYHPTLTGFASALLPGWGQVLNGDRIRAGIFLACVWIAGAVWIVLSPAATDLFSTYLPAVSTWEQALRRPGTLWIARVTFPAVVWALAVYDAASSAIHRRG